LLHHLHGGLMKKLLIIALLINSAHARANSTSCDVEWKYKETTDSVTTIKIEFYGNIDTGVSVKKDDTGVIRLKIMGPMTGYNLWFQNFASEPIDLKTTNISYILRKLRDLPKDLKLETQIKVSVNEGDLYCGDDMELPSKKTETTYKFPIQLESGELLYFTAHSTVENR
jgi:hypothetical protein